MAEETHTDVVCELQGLANRNSFQMEQGNVVTEAARGPCADLNVFPIVLDDVTEKPHPDTL